MADTKHRKTIGEVETKKHMFSEPWEDSDIILVVEEQKFHVHRVMLSMASPVFKAMLSGGFKEKAAAEIPLPGKKAEEMTYLLRQIYSQHQGDITMDNVEPILKLADEYQMRGVIKLCENVLLNEPMPNKNLATKILLLAQQYGMENVRKHCYKQLNGMTLDELEQLDGFQSLNGDSVREVLGHRLKKLEKFLKDVHPQFAGIVDCARFIWRESRRPIKSCPIHDEYCDEPPTESLQIRLTCSVCCEMLTSMATEYSSPGKYGEPDYPEYSCDIKFDKNIVAVLQDMFTLLKMKPCDKNK